MDVAAQPAPLRRVEPLSHPGGHIIRVTDARRKHSRGNFPKEHFCRPAVVVWALQ